MRGHIRRRPNGSVEAVHDAGLQPCQRCQDCGKRMWLAGRPERTCVRCGSGQLVIRTERRTTSTSHRTAREAEAALAEGVVKVGAGQWFEPARATVGEYLDEWLAAAAASRKPTTMSTYRMLTRAYVHPRIGGQPLRLLTAPRLNALYADLLTSGRRDGGPLGDKTVREVHSMLRRALADAVAWGYLATNPAATAAAPRPEAVLTDVWTPAQVRAFLEQTADDRLAAAYRLIAATGCRRGEAVGLRWADVDLDGGRVTFRENVTIADGQPVVTTPKSRKGRPRIRTISVDAATVAALREHRRRQSEQRLARGPGWVDSGRVFTRADGAQLNPNSLYRAFVRQVRAAGLPRCTVHGLRHAYATMLLVSGVRPKVVAQRLNHASPAITQALYEHVMPADDDEAAEVSGHLLAPRADDHRRADAG